MILFFTDIDSANILGIYGLQNRNVAGIVLGGDGPLLWGGGDTRSLLIRDRRGQDRANIQVNNIQVNTVYTTTIEAQGTIKSVNKSQYYIVPFSEIKARNDRCDRNQLYYQEKMLFCISGCNRWCQERKYSGGTITEFDPYKNLVGCVCLP